jgi:hypothetical protein
MNQSRPAASNAATRQATPPADTVPHDNRQQADEVILSHFGDFDNGGGDKGSISQADFMHVASDPHASAADRAAAQYYLDNPTQFSQLSQNVDPSQGSINMNAVKYANEQDAAKNIAANFNQLDTAAQGGSPDGFVSSKDLKAALNNKNLDPNLRSSINFLLANPDNLADLDEAGNATTEGGLEPDGILSQKDLSTVQDPNRQITAIDQTQSTFNPNGN